MAEALHAPLIALTVEDPRFERLPEARREALSENIALAQRLGAETLVVRGDDAAAQVLSVARERGVTRILVGRPRRPRWRSAFWPSRTERIVRSAGAIDVLVTAGETERGVVERLRAVPPPPRQLAREYAVALAAVCAPTIVCAVTTQLFSFTDQAMIYLLGVLFVSSRLTRGPALVNALASVAALDFFFVDPAWTLAVSDLRYVVTFGVMFAVALAVSHRTVIMREQAEFARERERRAASLFVMSRDFGHARTAQEVAEIATGHVRAVLDREAVLLAWRGPGRLERLAGAAFDPAVQTRDAAVAAWVAEYGQPAGRGTDTLPASAFLFLPLAGVKASRGVLGIELADAGELSPSQRQLVESFAAQTALALERIQLEAEAAQARLAAETERTRSTLLSSVGHDLRIPLSAIGGAAQVLLDESRPIGASDRRELLGTIQGEGERLARLVTNLLDLTRLESGVLAPKKEWCPVDEILASARGRLRERVGTRAVTVDVPELVLEVHGDPALLEQALVNLFDNALKHTPAGSALSLCARREGENAVLGVWDRGPGLSAGDQTRVFERFYRSADSHGVEGTGLGLAVVEAIARTHGGTARASAREGGGSCFEIVIPGARESSAVEGARPS
jgi:two-component system sensor histidine kinase KdpD